MKAKEKIISKKIISTILLILIVFAQSFVFPTRVNATDSITMSIDSEATELVAGQTILANVHLEGKTISSISGYLHVDENVFDTTKIKKASFIIPDALADEADWTTSYNATSGKFSIIADDASYHTIPDGLLVQISLVVKANTDSTDITINNIQATYPPDELFELAELIGTIPTPPADTTLTINPNGGTYTGQTSITQAPGTTYVVSGTPTTNIKLNRVSFNLGDGGQLTDPTQLTIDQEQEFDKWQCTGGGTFNTSTSTYTFGLTDGVLKAIYKGKNITLPAVTNNPGYTFKGWYTAATGGTKVGDAGGNYKPTSNIILYAQYDQIQYDLNVDPAGGTYKGSSSVTVEKGVIGEEKTIDNPVGPNGYTVTFYNNDGTTSSTPVTQVKAFSSWTKTGEGTWNPDTSKYTFASGTGTLTASYDDATPVTAPTFTRTGYTFSKWNTLSNGSGTDVTTATYVPTSNTSLYALWDANTYRITFDPGEGTVSPVIKDVVYDSPYGELPTPVRDGYTFDGWYIDDAKIQATDTVKITGAKTAIAHWTGNTYTVTFDPDGGTVTPTSKQVTHGQVYGALPTPTKDGFNFTGWYNITGSKVESSTTVNLINDEILTAHWTAKTYTVTFDPDGGTVTPTSKSAKTGEAYGELPTPTRTGYDFEGWYNADNTKVEASDIFNKTANETLTAHWTAKTYIITFDGDGVTITPESKEVTYDSTYGELPAPTKEGYEFDGWYIGSTKIQATDTVKITSDSTITAHWLGSEYVVTFDPNGGTVDPTSKTVRNDSPYGDLPTPVKTGYDFEGWYNTSEEKIESTTIVNLRANETLTAHWTESTYVLTFDPNGGTVSPTSKNVTYNSIYGELPVPTKDGYDFEGWYIGDTKIEATDTVTITANTTAVARWTGGTYIVIFDPNGGSVDVASKQVKNGQPYGELPTPVKEKYTFTGWYNEAGNKIEATTIVAITTNETLTAHWEQVEFPIELKVDDEVIAEILIQKGQPVGELPTPEKEGNNFLGWFDDDGNQVTSTTVFTNNIPSVLHARFEPKKYTVTYLNNDGSVIATQQVKHGLSTGYYDPDPQAANVPAGYRATFTGWDHPEKLNNVTEDTTINATYEYEKIVYTIEYRNTKDLNNSSNPTTYTVDDSNIVLNDLPNTETQTFLGWFTTGDNSGQRVDIIDTSEVKNVILYAHWTNDDLYLRSQKYVVGDLDPNTNDIDVYERGDIYLDKIEPNTTVAELIDNCDTNGSIIVINQDGDILNSDELVGSGMTIKCTKQNKKIELIAIVMDDLDGNGEVTITDLSMLNQAILKLNPLETYAFKAADIDDSKKITVTDLSTMNQVLLKVITPTYTKPSRNSY